MSGDYWWEQRYEDALLADCQAGHPGRDVTCHYCTPNRQEHT